MDLFTEKIINIIEQIDLVETDNIKKAAKIIFDSINKEKVVHVFATGHSHMFAEEMFYRAGGLVQVDPILVPSLMQHEGAIRSTHLERLPGLAKQIYDSLDLLDGEPFVIVSNSGINSVPIEMAKMAKENGHPIIVVTSLETSKELKPRNDFNIHLYELGDIVIDNHVPYGDGVIKYDYGQVGSSSSIAGNYIAQRMVLEIIDLYNQAGLIPPIYLSANLPGGDEHNKLLYKKYQKRIKSLY